MTESEANLIYRCLNLSDQAEWSDHAKYMFQAADGKPFKQWWRMCKQHFENPSDLTPYILDELDSADAYQRCQWEQEDDPSIVAIRFDINYTKRELQAAFRAFLKDRHPGRPGWPTEPKRFAEEFSVVDFINVDDISRMLDAKEWKVKTGDPYWKVGMECGYRGKTIDAGYVPMTAAEKLKRPDDIDEDTRRRRILDVSVSRAIKRVDELIKGIIKHSEFPTRPKKNGPKAVVV